jgi:luciferase family oxidoreductase group 1
VADLLRRGASAPSDQAYAGDVRELLGYFTPGGAAGVRAPLAESSPPQPWLLGSGPSSAALAAELGLPLAVANHIRPSATESALDAYRSQFKPSRWLDRSYAMVSVTVVAAETSARAEELARPYDVLIAQARTGQGSPLATIEQAADYQFTTAERERIATLRAGAVQGDAGQVKQGLAELTARFDPDELIVNVPVYAIDERVAVLATVAGSR